MNKFVTKIVSLIAVLSIIVPVSFAPSTALAAPAPIFTDDFESDGNLTGWTADSKWSEQPAGIFGVHSGSRAARAEGNTGTTPDNLEITVSTVGYESITFSYWRKVTAILGPLAHFRAEWFDGTDWNEVAHYTSIATTGWSLESFSLPVSAENNADFKVRFRADFNTFLNAVRIDDVGVTGYHLDTDVDEVVDLEDNCPFVANPDQADTDEDGIGNACEATGSIEITKYACPADTELLRSVNGVGGTVPLGCSLQSGAHFGYVHGNGVGPDGPHDDVLGGDVTHEIGGVTNGSGVLAISGLEATGRYLVYETNSDYVKLPDSEILNLYCEGDGEDNDTASDNQELTFVTEGGTAKCVAYNEGDFELPDEPAVCAVSDINDEVVGGGNAVLVGSPNGSWTTLSGANWIWSVDPVADPAATVTVSFKKTITITGTPSAAILEIATDNNYDLYVDNVLIESDPAVDNFSSADSIDLTSQLTAGNHTLRIAVTNTGVPEETNPLSNPAGLLYRLTVTGGACSVQSGDDDGGDDESESAILWIYKNTIGNGGSFNFSVSGEGSVDEDYQDFTITTEGDGDSNYKKVYINPDGYNSEFSITEELPLGWELTDVSCGELSEGEDYSVNGSTLNLIVDPNDMLSCTFTNTATAGVLTVIKHVINNDGETSVASQFGIKVANEGDLLEFNGSESGTDLLLKAGTFTVTENESSSYTTTYSGDCDGSIALGEHKTCTITNDDIENEDGTSSGSEANEDGNTEGSVLGASVDTEGSVLGALSCSFLTYEQLITIKDGKNADPEIVKALQEWLNSSQNAGLTVNGIYDEPTKFAIMLLQEKYASEVLSPWGIEKATGNVWKTTAKLIMKLVCGENVEIGVLVPFEVQ